MRGFEVVVRPVVFPNIRPAPAQSLPPADDPDKGFAIIRGNGGKHIDLSNSFSASTASGGGSETKRRVNTARVYQKDEQGKVNKKNFIDVDIITKLWTKEPPEPQVQNKPSAQPSGYSSPGYQVPAYTAQGFQVEKGVVYSYTFEKDNIKIIKRNTLKPAVRGP